MGCLSDEQLERHLLSPLDAVRDHLSGCAACRARIDEAEAEGRYFRAFAFPKTIDPLLAAAAPRPRSFWRFAVPAFAALAAALFAFTLPLSATAPDDYVGLKGGGVLGLTLFTLDAARQPIALADGARVPAGAPLRFRVAPGRACNLWLVSLDARGTVSHVFPSEGAAVRVSEATELPGGALLDAVSGPERFFAVCGDDGLSLARIDAAARKLGAGAEAVRGARALDGLPAGARQATVLLEKVP